jgi:beta-ribofuranosylaminobenzene 5'-phosphate synthase
MRTHVGMGSGTAIRLATLEALYTINGVSVPRDGLTVRSGRGGTSGIGINTYFDGGLILDLGVKAALFDFLPSSQPRPGSLPTTLPPLSMPQWPLALCVPRGIQPKSQDQELEFFKRTTPLDPESSFRSAYDALFGIYAAVAEIDYAAFCKAVDSIQSTSWKDAEWHEYGTPLTKLRDDLLRAGADCVRMSSLGPMLFCFGRADALANIARNHVDFD